MYTNIAVQHEHSKVFFPDSENGRYISENNFHVQNKAHSVPVNAAVEFGYNSEQEHSDHPGDHDLASKPANYDYDRTHPHTTNEHRVVKVNRRDTVLVAKCLLSFSFNN